MARRWINKWAGLAVLSLIGLLVQDRFHGLDIDGAWLVLVIVLLSLAALVTLTTWNPAWERIPFEWVGPGAASRKRKGTFFDRINIDDEVFKNKTIDLTDFTRYDFMIRNKVFLNCDILGPAVLHLFGPDSMLKHCQFDHPKPLYQTFWWPDPEGKRRAGTVVIENCQFSNCRLLGISITDSPEIIDAMRQKTVVPTFKQYEEPREEEEDAPPTRDA